MRDIVLENLKSTYNTLNVNGDANKKYLTEAKKRFSHLTEGYLIDNKPVIDNIRNLSVSSKDIMDTFHVSFAVARNLKKSYDAFAIAEYFARTENDAESFNNKLNESCKVILELEGEFDPNKTLGGSIDVDSGADQFDPNARIGGNGDFGGDGKAYSKAKPDNKKKEEKKKGFIVKVKEFLKKAADFVKTVATSKATYKVIAIGAVMVILGVVATTIGGWVAVGFGAVKGLLGLFAIFKGSKEIIKTSDYAKGKKGLAGVSQWIKSAKDPKNAAKILLGISQIALGAWGASSAISGIMNEIATMDAMKMYNPDGVTVPSTSTSPHEVQHAAKATTVTSTPDTNVATNNAAPVSATADMSKYTSYGASKASALQDTIQRAAIDGNVEAMSKPLNLLGTQIGDAVKSGKLTSEQGAAILKGFAEKFHSSNGGIPSGAIFTKLMSLAKLG